MSYMVRTTRFEIPEAMTVAQLIEVLKMLPPGAMTYYVWEGTPTPVNCIWLARNGKVCMGDYNDDVYEKENWPEDAVPNEYGHWHTPKAR